MALAVALGLTQGLFAAAQSGPPDGGTTSPPLLRAYVNLVQIPVLILDRARRPATSLSIDRFRVSIDSGPSFRPRYVRQEGDDPIHLAVLIDGNGAMQGSFADLGNAVSVMALRSLRAEDSISIAMMRRCMVSRSAMVAGNDGRLAQAVAVLTKKVTEDDASRPCHEAGLWDTTARMAQEFGSRPGRRVVLLLTDGCDRGSKLAWTGLKYLADGQGVTVLAIRPESSAAPSCVPLHPSREMDELQSVTELTGGVVLRASSADLLQTLKEVPALLRNRYIVEFTRPRKLARGAHVIEVAVAGKGLFVRPAGISVTLPGPEKTLNSAEHPATATDTPAGTRRVLTPGP